VKTSRADFLCEIKQPLKIRLILLRLDFAKCRCPHMSVSIGVLMRVVAAFQMLGDKKLKWFILAQILRGDLCRGARRRRVRHHDFPCARSH
jgi:hypothetical protein